MWRGEWWYCIELWHLTESSRKSLSHSRSDNKDQWILNNVAKYSHSHPGSLAPTMCIYVLTGGKFFHLALQSWNFCWIKVTRSWTKSPIINTMFWSTELTDLGQLSTESTKSGIPRFLAFCLTSLHTDGVLYKMEGLCSPASGKSIDTHFSNSICSLLFSVSYFGNSRNISSFSLLLYLLWWSVVYDVAIVILGGPMNSILTRQET